MIKHYYLFILILFLTVTEGFSQSFDSQDEFSFIVHGKVYDDSTGNPIANHEVTITTDGGYQKNVMTRADGNYGDTINGLNDPLMLVHVYTRDCENIIHSQSVTAGTLQTIINFSICGSVAPPVTYPMGGMLFAGNFPINNPENTGDTGVVYLYHVKGNNLEFVQVQKFTEYGYFYFLSLPEGDYKIRAELTPNSIHYSSFIPAWYSNDLHWNSSTVLNLADSNTFQANIHLFEKPLLATGSGKIGGHVEEARGFSSHDDLIQNAEILLLSQDGTPMDFRMSDNQGKYSFDDLPSGNYKLYAEFPNMYSQYTEITITDANPVAENVVLKLYNHAVGTEEIGGEVAFGPVFPNPVRDIIRFRCSSNNSGIFHASIINMNGLVSFERQVTAGSGTSVIEIPVTDLKDGMYLLLMHDQNGNLVKKEKFVR